MSSIFSFESQLSCFAVKEILEWNHFIQRSDLVMRVAIFQVYVCCDIMFCRLSIGEFTVELIDRVEAVC